MEERKKERRDRKEAIRERNNIRKKEKKRDRCNKIRINIIS